MHTAAPTMLEFVQVWIAAALNVAAVPALALALARAVRVWSPPSRERSWLARVLVVGALLRLVIAPKWTATLFIGYRTVAQVLELPVVPHYGAGVFVFHRPLLELLGRDDAVLLWMNVPLGVVALPLFASLARDLLGDARTAVVATALVAITPLFVRNDASDALQVPMVLWLLGGLVLLREYMQVHAISRLVGAAVLLALVSVSRPEACVVAAFGAALVVLTSDGWRERGKPLGIAALLVGVLCVPHLVHVFGQVSSLQGRSSLPSLDLGYLLRVPGTLVFTTVLLQLQVFPVVFTAASVAGVATASGARRRVSFGLVAWGLLAQLVSIVDLGWANLARVLVWQAACAVLLASAGLVWAWDRIVWSAGRAILVVLVTVNMAATTFPLFSPTNEQAEDDFLREAAARLPDGPFLLLRPDAKDLTRDASRGLSHTHAHFPDYLFTPPSNVSGAVSSLGRFLEAPDFSRPVFLFVGMRCYAEYRMEGTPPPKGSNELPACAAFRERFVLEPVLSRTVPNRGDVWLPYYGDAPELTLGLHRVRERSTTNGAAP